MQRGRDVALGRRDQLALLTFCPTSTTGRAAAHVLGQHQMQALRRGTA